MMRSASRHEKTLRSHLKKAGSISYNRIKATREGDKVVTLSRILLLMRKYDEENSACLLSHPVRGAWIEIEIISAVEEAVTRRTPSGVRGLKCYFAHMDNPEKWVAPRQGCVD